MDYKVNKIKLSVEEGLYKIKNWCAYQERSQYDVRQKLFTFGLSSEDVEHCIANLISENFLNEERFAMAFVSGKLRIKHWGRRKIKIELKKHKVSDYCANKALKAIDEKEYETILIKAIEKKIRLTKITNRDKQYYSILNYLMTKGFENDLVIEQLNVLLKK